MRIDGVCRDEPEMRQANVRRDTESAITECRTYTVLFGCSGSFEPFWNIPGVCYEGMSLTEDIDSGMFPFTARMASIRPILFSGLFCFVLLSWINRERLIHFFRKTGYSKILQATMKQTCSRTIIFIKEPNSMHGSRLRGVARLPPWCLP